MKYRKKPVVIEARQLEYNLSSINNLISWIGNDKCKQGADGCILIETLEGTMKAVTGDYIIKGIQGEFYPCKSDIFEVTYEAVE